ncbi:MAG: DUF87 domain-containing protein [Calditrichaeota bacterium]|nr:MAG: DUF87 domain-containing protein [Calditrichota bacterium]
MPLPDISFDELRNLSIGTVESVSTFEIRVLLDINTPQNTSLNTGEPMLFPKINGYVLIPNEAGALVCIISWMGIENSPYPKRKGFKDFDLIDLPFPLRKMTVNPLGILKKEINGKYKLDRGVYSYPSVGDSVVIPTRTQLESIVENKDKNACIQIGISPLAANSPVYVDPDKLFGRHIAVLGNTGSGKSCSVAGLIRWSLNSAQNHITKTKEKVEDKDDIKIEAPNARFIILDPNGEYSDVFDDFSVRKFRVSLGKDNEDFQQLRVPAWMWNSYEWNSITQASGRTQRPLLRRALRELRGGDYETETNAELEAKRFLTSILISLKNKLISGPASYADFPGKQNLGEFLNAVKKSMENLGSNLSGDVKNAFTEVYRSIKSVLDQRKPNQSGYYPSFEHQDLKSITDKIMENKDRFGGLAEYNGPDEDSPVFFKADDLPDHLERLAQEQNVQQFLDFLIMRIRTMLSDTRMSAVIGTKNDINLLQWLEKYIGKENAEDGQITIIDLSLVPSDILHIVVSVISRIIFEALQRYRRKYETVLPTVLVMEEAHNFISKYNYESEDFAPARLCSQTFEKIAKEGRKFGLGLVLSSQRPSELSPTVLSQCNTFLLHRIVNDKDQELVKKLVPDNLGKIINELPTLPTRKAILLGWAAPIPVLVEINELEEKHRPKSKDPDFWDVWIGLKERTINWEEIVREWQNEKPTEQR